MSPHLKTFENETFVNEVTEVHRTDLSQIRERDDKQEERLRK